LEGGKSIYLCTRAPEWNSSEWRERERKGKEEDCPLRESEIGSKIFKVSLLYLGSLSCRFSRPVLPKKASYRCPCANKL
jgi:hypothetical protein